MKKRLFSVIAALVACASASFMQAQQTWDDPGLPVESIEADKGYYLLNAGSGSYLANGGNSAVQAIVGNMPAAITFEEVITENSADPKTYYMKFTNVLHDQDLGTVTYLRTDNLNCNQLAVQDSITGVFSIEFNAALGYFSLYDVRVDTTALNEGIEGKFLAARTETHLSTGQRWGTANGLPTLRLEMAIDPSSRSQWYIFDAELYDARERFSNLLLIAQEVKLADLATHVAAYNFAETVEAANTAYEALRARIAEDVTSTVDVTAFINKPKVHDGVTPILLSKWRAFNADRLRLPGIEHKVEEETFKGGAFEYYQTVFDFHQKLTGLPAGKYTLKAQAYERAGAQDGGAAYEAGTETRRSRLYAASTVTEFNKPLESLYKHKWEEAMSGYDAVSGNPIQAVGNMDNGYYADGMVSGVGAFILGYYQNELTDIIVGDDGILTIGVKSESTTGRFWVMFSSFALEYHGVDLSPLAAVVTAKIAEAQAIIDDVEADRGWFNKTELESAVAQGNAVEQTADSYNAAIAALDAAMSKYKTIIAAYQLLGRTIVAAELNLEETDFPGKAAYQTAFDKAIGVYASTTEVDFAAAAIELSAAWGIYFCTQPASKTEPLDLTPLMSNPGFDSNIPGSGWTSTPNNPTWDSGLSLIEYFRLQFHLRQTLHGLPAGTYDLSVQGFERPAAANITQYNNYINGTAVMTSKFYVNVNDTEAASTPLRHVFSVMDKAVGSHPIVAIPLEVGEETDSMFVNSRPDARAAFNAEYFVHNLNNIVVNEGNSSLTIGVSANSEWIALDNFRLIYYGSEGLKEKVVVIEPTFYIVSTQNGIRIVSKEMQPVKIYAITGQLIKSLVVSKGETTVSLAKGMYIVNNKKVIVK